jgi:SPP1 family phage portal protein
MLDIKHTQKDLTIYEIKKLIDTHRMYISHYRELQGMYDTKNAIRSRVKSDMTVPNNKIAHSYANYIVTCSVGYFMGKEITYNFPGSYGDAFNDIYKFNDEKAVNMQLATDCSIFGQAVEMLFMDEESNIRFAPVDITEIIAIRTPDVIGDVHTIIRHWDEDDIIEDRIVTYVEVYYQDRIEKYMYGDIDEYEGEAEVEQHPFSDVPFIVYDNNNSKMGDFEPVIDLINAYDKAQSDTANDFESFTDCYLVVKGATLDAEQAQQLKELKVFNFPDSEGDVSFVTKQLNDAATEDYKNRLDNDIHKFSCVPNMSDESFASNASGVAMQYKLAGLNYKTAVKEALFKKGLLRRIELINGILNITCASEEIGEPINLIKDVDIKFTRNTIDNLSETADLVNKLVNIISKETALELLKDIIDPELEKQRVEEEKEANMALMQEQGLAPDSDEENSEDVNNDDIEGESEEK